MRGSGRDFVHNRDAPRVGARGTMHSMMSSRTLCGLAITLLSLAACGGRATQDEEGSDAPSGGSGDGGDGPQGASGAGGVTGTAGHLGASGDAGDGGDGAAGSTGVGGSGAAGMGGGAVGTGGAGMGGRPTGGAGTGGSAAASTGGAGTGGRPTGGAGTGGLTAGGAAGEATGSGGTALGDACTAPPEPGTCDLEVWQFRHDPELGLCVPYEFNACDSSPNRYATRDECLAACRGGEPDLDACVGFEDCVVTSLACCGSCDPVDPAALVAVNVDRTVEYNERIGCGFVACEMCLPVAPNEQIMKYLYGACVEGQCTVRDLRERPVAECDTAADCALRCGAGCCPGCTADVGVVAYRAGADLADELCGGGPTACDDCDCQIPPEYAADCVEGHCVAVIGPVCEPGLDQTCNADEWSSALAGTCNPDGTCRCDVWIDPATGRCE